MTDITIPPAALEAAEEAFLEADRVPSNSFEDCIRAAALALLENWPGAYRSDPALFGHKLILPLDTQENENG